MENNKVQGAYKNLRASLRAAREVLKNEGPETKHAAQLLIKLGGGKKISSKEARFLKLQAGDFGKMVGLFTLFMVPGGSFLIPLIAAGLKKIGINPFPSSQEHLRKEELVRKQIRKMLAEELLREQEEIRMKFDLPIPQDIWDMKPDFDAAGKKLFLVGGAVRDALTKKSIKDYDLATDATPEEMSQFLPQASKKEAKANGGLPPKGKYVFIEAGNIFPVVHLVTSDGGRYEIATFREDLASDEAGGHRKPETKVSTIDNDVKRRDLTVNALFYDLDTKEIVDLVGGIRDIQQGNVRTVGDPTARFAENEIRKLRALRFAARMGSELDDAIKQSLAANPSLATEAPEAIQKEFLKGIKQAQDVSYYIRMIFEYGLDKWVFKGFSANPKYIINEKDPTLLFASITRDANRRNVRAHLKQNLKYSDDFAKRVMFFIMFQDFTPEQIMAYYKLNKATAHVAKQDLLRAADILGYDKSMVDAFYRFEPIADAQELMAQGYKKQELGRAMNQINIDHFKSLL